MIQVAQTFSSCMLKMTTPFFYPLMDRKRLEAHDYWASTEIHTSKEVRNCEIDVVKLPPNCLEKYLEALDIVTKSRLMEYLSQIHAVLPEELCISCWVNIARQSKKLQFSLLKEVHCCH